MINALRGKNGRLITHEKRIQEEQQKFYEVLYKSRKDELRPPPDYLDTVFMLCLSDDEKLLLDEPLVFEEVFEAIRMLKNGKCAGTDGLSIEVYKTYKHKLMPLLLELYQEILREGKMLLLARRGIISLLEKVGKDPLESGNWEAIDPIKL